MVYKPSNELENYINKLLGTEKKDFFDCIGNQLPHTIRFNTLKADINKSTTFFREQGFDFEPFPGFKDVYRITYQSYPLGRSLSHYLGHFYVQDIASMLPPRILDPKPGEYVLDMSAAPGSKTTQMALMMNNEGMILANDIIPKRLRALITNLQRIGIINTAVVKNYGESLGNQYFEKFDKVLLDPACSGLGTLHKSPEVLTWWTLNHCNRMATNQKSLINSAVKALKAGGYLVYSTCTITPEENEEVINHALKQFPLEVEKIRMDEIKVRPGLTSYNRKKFHPDLKYSKRIYPFDNQTEGFYVAKLRKTEPLDPRSVRSLQPSISPNFISDTTSPVKKYLDYISFHFDIERNFFKKFRYYIDKNITVVTPEIANFLFKNIPLKTGIVMAKTLKQIAKLTTEGILLIGNNITKNTINLSDKPTLEKFVNRKVLKIPFEGRVQIFVQYNGIPIGYGLDDNGKLKSQFPKAEWPFTL